MVIIIIYHSLESVLLHSVTYLVNGIMCLGDHFNLRKQSRLLYSLHLHCLSNIGLKLYIKNGSDAEVSDVVIS